MSSVELSDQASDLVRRMVSRESRGWGDKDAALIRLEAKYGLPFWTLENLRKGRAKTVETSLYFRLRAAFVDHCGAHAVRLLHEAETAMAVDPNDDVEGIESEIRALEDRLAIAPGPARAARKARMK